jgi:hypothetical protein
MDAWDLVMRALSHYWRVTRQDNVVAQALLEKAIAIDPSYASATMFGNVAGDNPWNVLRIAPSTSVLDEPAFHGRQRCRSEDDEPLDIDVNRVRGVGYLSLAEAGFEKWLQTLFRPAQRVRSRQETAGKQATGVAYGQQTPHHLQRTLSYVFLPVARFAKVCADARQQFVGQRILQLFFRAEVCAMPRGRSRACPDAAALRQLSATGIRDVSPSGA